jgi:hypothetical protein
MKSLFGELSPARKFLCRLIGKKCAIKKIVPSNQGCQIFLGQKYQNVGKYTKLP